MILRVNNFAPTIMRSNRSHSTNLIDVQVPGEVIPVPVWSISTTQTVRVLSEAGSSTVENNDANVTRSTGASTITDYQLAIQAVDSSPTTFASLTPSIATVDEFGSVTGVSAGTVAIQVDRGGLIKNHQVTISTTAGSVQDAFLSWVTGTLAKQATDYVDTALAGKSAATTIQIFSSQNHTTQSYVRNPSLWCAGLAQKLTCCSPWNSTGANTRAGTLVTPRHILFAAHYQISDGATVRFITSGGAVINRTMMKKKLHPSYNPYFPDLVIGVLDSDVPATITPCSAPPGNFETYLPNLNYGVPCICLDQEEKALVADAYSDTSYQTFRVPTDSKRLEFHENKIVGDSGNPAFMVVDGELVMLTVWTYGGAGSGTDIGDQITALNQMIVDTDTLAGYSTVDDETWPNAAGHYKLKEADLSGFPSY